MTYLLKKNITQVTITSSQSPIILIQIPLLKFTIEPIPLIKSSLKKKMKYKHILILKKNNIKDF